MYYVHTTRLQLIDHFNVLNGTTNQAMAASLVARVMSQSIFTLSPMVCNACAQGCVCTLAQASTCVCRPGMGVSGGFRDRTNRKQVAPFLGTLPHCWACWRLLPGH